MNKHESELLYHERCYEVGHPRRTQHILKVYTLAKLLGEKEALSEKDWQILQAAAILYRNRQSGSANFGRSGLSSQFLWGCSLP